MKKICNKQSIFVKLCTVFFLAIFVLFLIGYSIYNWGMSRIRKEIIYNACVQNKNFSDTLNNEFKRIIMLQYELADNWDLLKLSTPITNYSEYEKSLMILRIKDKIYSIKTSSKFIDEISVAIPFVNELIQTITTKDITASSLNLIKNYENMNCKQIIYYNDKLLLISEYPKVYYEQDLPPSFLIYSTISKDAMNKFLNQMKLYNQSNGFIFSESRNMLICDDGTEATTEKIKQNILNKPGKVANLDNDAIKNTYVSSECVDGINYIMVCTDTGLADIKLVRYVPENVAFGGLKKYQAIMWIFAVTSVIFVAFFLKSLYSTIHAPLKKLVKAFDKVQNVDSIVSIEHNKNDEFKYIYDSFNKMTFKLHNLIEQVYKQKILVQKAKLKQLQAQINPHFLYNSFIILSNRIQAGDNEFASEFCRELGSFFMFITRNKSDTVPLKYEVQHAVTYSKIQHARFYNRVSMNLEPLPKEYENIIVPKIILQPILENAFEHTLEDMESGGFLHMAYNEHDKYLDIIIEDNGSNLDDAKINQMRNNLNSPDVEVSGMINIHRRLKLAYSHNSGIALERSKHGGLKVVVRIPINNCEVKINA